MMREPIDVPPIVSVELIQIKTKLLYHTRLKQEKLLKKLKKNQRVVSEQAPPSAKAKEKPDEIPLPEDKKETKQIVKKNKIQKRSNLKLDNHLNLRRRVLTPMRLQL